VISDVRARLPDLKDKQGNIFYRVAGNIFLIAAIFHISLLATTMKELHIRLGLPLALAIS
jgi:hypothetical protein